MQKAKRIISNHLINLSGWTTKKKIVVFESDDWGSIRMPSIKAYQNLLAAGIRVDKSPYCQFDNLCSSDDILLLFELLQKHKDCNGTHPKITANVVVGNPDFEKIKGAHYKQYYYETIADTFDRFFPNNNPLSLWTEGLNSDIFLPQFHGREHINVAFWLNLLQKNDSVFIKAFDQGCWGISSDVYNVYPKSVQASFDYNHLDELNFMKDSIADGLRIFEKLFGYSSKSFIPNNYIWASELNQTLIENDVYYMQGMKYQLLPKPDGTIIRQKIRRYNGQIIGDSPGILQTVRNVQFEPSFSVGSSDRSVWIKSCLEQIKTAFFWKKPAIVSIHRINFCGSLSEANRNQNIVLFDQLLKEIIKKWPDVVFMDTVSLAEIMH